MDVLRVSGRSRPNSVAGAVAALLRSEGRLEMQAIGPHAVNQAVKALAIARSYVEEDGIDLISAPSFVTLDLHDEERTALRFHVRAVPRDEGLEGDGFEGDGATSVAQAHPGLSHPE